MVVSAEQERVKSLIVDTVSLLCKNGLHYSKEFSIEGLLGITLDRDNVFLVNIKEIVKNEAYEGSDSCSDTEAAKSKRRKRKKRQRANSVDSDHSSDEDNHVDNASVISNSQEPPSKRLGNVKQETGAEEEDDDEDLVFIKDEPGVDFSQCSFSQVDTNNAQGNSVLGDLSQQLYNPSHQQQQMQWNNTGPPGGSSDQFNNSASSQQVMTPPRHRQGLSTTTNSNNMASSTPSFIGGHFPCQLCQRVLRSEEQLREHMVRHTTPYKYNCDICSRGFSSTTGLMQHKTSHTGINYFKCNVCTESFSHSYKLSNHMKKDHPDKVPARPVLPGVMQQQTFQMPPSLFPESLRHGGGGGGGSAPPDPQN